jgi:hypothetical protein
MCAAYNSGIIPENTRIARLTAKSRKADLTKLIKKHVTRERPITATTSNIVSASASGSLTPEKAP